MLFRLFKESEQAIEIAKEVLSQVENPHKDRNYIYNLPENHPTNNFKEYVKNNKEEIKKCLDNLKEILPYLKTLETRLRQKN